MADRLEELERKCVEPLLDRLLKQLRYTDDTCPECCEYCERDKPCGDCDASMSFIPKGVFVCKNGHEHSIDDFFKDPDDLLAAMKGVLGRVSEFVENRMIIETREEDLPVYVNHEFKFESSRDYFEERLKSVR